EVPQDPAGFVQFVCQGLRGLNDSSIKRDILKKAQLLSPRAMVVDSIQTLDSINT
ncbi:hypothetical protein S83_069883, partial [Arachis hypogaea]